MKKVAFNGGELSPELALRSDMDGRRRTSPHNPDMDILEIPFPRNKIDRVRMTADIHGMPVGEYISRTIIALSDVPRHNI